MQVVPVRYLSDGTLYCALVADGNRVGQAVQDLAIGASADHARESATGQQVIALEAACFQLEAVTAALIERLRFLRGRTHEW